MSRPPKHPDQPLTRVVSFKISDRMLEVITDLRGPQSQADFFRDLVRSEYKRRKRAAS